MTRPEDIPDGRRFDLRYTGSGLDGLQTVPAAVLAEALEALQRMVHLLAMRAEGRALNRRARPSADIQQRFPVHCFPPVEGSYLSPTFIAGETIDLLGDGERDRIAQELTFVLEAANSGDPEVLDRAVPDPTYRRFMYQALEDLSPPASSGLELEVQRSGQSLFIASRARPAVIRKAIETAQSRGFVIGRLHEIDFAGQRFGLYHQPSERLLTCTYDAGGEAMLLEHPLDLIQVEGVLERDEDGKLIRVVQVDAVIEVELSPLTLESLSLNGLALRANRPIKFEVELDPDDQLFVARSDELHLHAFAETREELEHAIYDELVVLWREYALADDETLTAEARELKRSLLELFLEKSDAPQA